MEIRENFNTILQNKNLVMFIITFAFILGVIAYYNNSEVMIAIFTTVIAIVLLHYSLIPKNVAILTILMFYAGFFNADLRIKSFDNISLLAPNELEISGKIVSIPETKDYTSKFYFEVFSVDDKPLNGKVFVWLTDKTRDFSSLKIGNNYKIKGNLRLPTKCGNPSQFDYAKFLQNHDTYSLFYVDIAKNSIAQIDSKLTPKWRFIQDLNEIRVKILNVHSTFLKSPNLEILGGIVFGDDAVSPPDYIKNSFINSGLLHILAASGMNVAFIWGFCFFFLRRFRVSYKITHIVGIFAVILYTLMTGLGASVVRAGLMLGFVLVGKLFDRDAHSVSLLSFVALLMLIYNPAYLNDIGFQMSFLATLGILTTGQAVAERLSEVKIPNLIKGDTIIPIIAQGWVAPTQMLYFNTFAPFSILANIAIIPFLCVVSFGGFLTSILAIFYPYTKFLCKFFDLIINFLITIIVNISNFFSNLQYSLIVTPKPTIMQLVLYYSILVLITLLIKYGWKKRLYVPIIFTLFALLLTFIKIPNSDLEIITFDVQNADCFLIKTPKNEYIAVDSGKFPYTSQEPQASRIIGKYLKDNGIRSLKALIITHFDNDHAGGGAYLIRNFAPQKVYLNTQEAKSVTAKTIFNALEETKIEYEISENNSIMMNYDDFGIKFLIPQIKENENENSLQTLIKYKDFDILLTGDAGVKGFEKIKNFLPQNVDVFKVGHHGAKGVTNSEMLDALNPQIAIISTGTNSFGHPSKQTLENLYLKNIKTYRTDYDNAIKITSNGTDIKVFTYNPRYRNFVKVQSITAK